MLHNVEVLQRRVDTIRLIYYFGEDFFHFPNLRLVLYGGHCSQNLVIDANGLPNTNVGRIILTRFWIALSLILCSFNMDEVA